MIIKKINIEGFKSIGSNLTLDFDDNGVFLIKGKNGLGKSTIFEALYWGLYGQQIKNTTNDSLLTLKPYRPSDYKGVRVVIDVQIDGDNIIQVIRTHEYSSDSSLKVYHNNELIPYQDKAHSQSILLTLLGIPENVFRNSIFFAQKSMSFLNLKDADKRDLLDSLFDLDLDIYLNKAVEKTTSLKQDIDTKQLSKSELNRFISQSQEEVNKYIGIIDNFEIDKKKNLAALDLQILDVTNQLNALVTDNIEPVAPDPIPPSQTLSNIHVTNTKIGNIDNLIVRESKPIIDTCKECSQPLPADKVKELTDRQTEAIAKLNEDKKVLEKEVSDLNLLYQQESVKIKEHQDLVTQYNLDITNYRQIENARLRFKTQLDGFNNHRQSIDNQNCDNIKLLKESAETQIANKQAELEFIDKEIEKLTYQHSLYEYWAKTGFTNKGLKSYIFQALLVKLNDSLEYYSKYLGISVNLDIKTSGKAKSFETTIKTKDGIDRLYESLSGGEQKRVDLIISFALSDLQGSKVNICLMDEMFNHLDEEGLEIASLLLKDKSRNKAIYVIDHNVNFSIVGANTINISKTNNITKIN